MNVIVSHQTHRIFCKYAFILMLTMAAMPLFGNAAWADRYDCVERQGYEWNGVELRKTPNSPKIVVRFNSKNGAYAAGTDPMPGAKLTVVQELDADNDLIAVLLPENNDHKINIVFHIRKIGNKFSFLSVDDGGIASGDCTLMPTHQPPK